MAFFVGAGIISEDVVRKETRNGVLAVFRLETGAPNSRKLWIDVEAWGQLAGTVAHHATKGRGVLVSGRLTYKTWRDRQTGHSRHRLVVAALDVDFCQPELAGSHPPTTVVASGRIETLYPKRSTTHGTVCSFRLSCGRAGSKTGRLWIDVEHWQSAHTEPPEMSLRQPLTISGQLDYRGSGSIIARQGGLTGLHLQAIDKRAPQRQHARP